MELRELFESFGKSEKLNSKIGRSIDNHQKKTLHERTLYERIELEMIKYIENTPNADAIDLYLHIKKLRHDGKF